MSVSRLSSRRVTTFLLVAIYAGLLVAAGFIPANEALAATINVETPNDGYDEKTNNNCTLREAIVSANTNTAIGGCEAGSGLGTDVINLDPDTYTLTLSGFDEDSGLTGDLDVTEDLTITGTGASRSDTVIDAGSTLGLRNQNLCGEKISGSTGIDRVFHVHDAPAQTSSSTGPPTVGAQGIEPSVSLSLSGLTVSGGSVFDKTPFEQGGGILAEDAALTLDDTLVQDNAVLAGESSGGGIAVDGESTLDMTASKVYFNAVFAGNEIAVGGGLSLIPQFVKNTSSESPQSLEEAARSSSARNARSLGPTTPQWVISDSLIANNRACGFNDFASGGGIFGLGVLSLTDTDLKNNEVVAQTALGGGADFGAGAEFVGSGPLSSWTYEGGVVEGNHATSYDAGGGFSPPGSAGGGLAGAGFTSLEDLTIRDNQAESFDEKTPTVFAAGGGVVQLGTELSIDQSTINGNSALVIQPNPTAQGGPSLGASEGGGLASYIAGGVVTNSTFSDNEASLGGGAFVASDDIGKIDGPIFDFLYSTITDNNGDDGGGLAVEGSAETVARLLATIIADQQGLEDCSEQTEDQIDSNGHNLTSDSTCNLGSTDLPSENPLLENLGNNGGGTRTHALKPNSKAVDHIAPASCPGKLDVDQRGVDRPQDGDGQGGAQCDIGAFELEPDVPEFCPGFKNDPRDQIVGTAANNTLNGTNQDEIICGKDGNDTINAGGGDDLVLGGKGGDKIKGESGEDRLDGEDGPDEISGGTANDRILGGDKSDVLSGDTGADELEGGAGDDTVDGNDGNDLVIGSGNDDTLRGGQGEDFLRGFTGEDKLFGGTEDDTLSGGAQNDVLNGEAGADDLDGVTGKDDLFGGTGPDEIFGHEGDDMLDGGPANDLLRGFKGDDKIFGRAGNDHLNGSFGDDDLDGGPDSDTCIGGAGTNTFVSC